MKTQTTKWTPKPRDTGTFAMWLCLPMGQYAISHRWPGTYDETDPRDIQVRSRKRKYLDRLRESFLPQLGPDEGRAGQGTDYSHRSFVSSTDLARGMARMALATDASGFKDHCWDNDLHNAYSQVWSALLPLDDASPYNWVRPRKELCAEFGSHWFPRPEGDSVCKDCGCVRTQVPPGVFRYRHPKGAVRLTDSYGKPLEGGGSHGKQVA